MGTIKSHSIISWMKEYLGRKNVLNDMISEIKELLDATFFDKNLR